jgi:hypothetical protein
MARITVQTDDRRTVLEERDVKLDHIRDEACASDLVDRLRRAVQDTERPSAPRRPARRLASIVPARDYRLVGV